MGAALMAAARLVPVSAATDPTPPAVDFPKFPCSQGITDDQGDENPKFFLGEDTSAVIPKSSARDIRAVDIRLTHDYLEVFMGVQSDPTKATMQKEESAYRYEVTFVFNGKTFDYGYELDNTTQDPGKDLGPGDKGQYPKESDGTGGNVAGSTVQILPDPNGGPVWIVWASPRAAVESGVGPITDGTDIFKNIIGVTYDYVLNQQGTADQTSASGTAAQYVAGDDSCFGPPPTSLTPLTVPAAVYHHAATLTTTLLDQNSKPLAGKPVTFTIQAATPVSVTAATDANGVAKGTFSSVSVPAGSYPVTATFPGETGAYKTSSVSGTLKVSAEKTAFTALKVAKASATTRTVTVSLLDDLKKPIAGVHVDWYVNGKKTSSVTTDKTGKAVLKGAKPGQKVQARYAGKPGYWLASVSSTVKLS
jgi:hypothetical protein